MTHDFFTLASSKAVEYGIAISLPRPVHPFWRYAQGRGLLAAPSRAAVRRADHRGHGRVVPHRPRRRVPPRARLGPRPAARRRADRRRRLRAEAGRPHRAHRAARRGHRAPPGRARVALPRRRQEGGHGVAGHRHGHRRQPRGRRATRASSTTTRTTRAGCCASRARAWTRRSAACCKGKVARQCAGRCKPPTRCACGCRPTSASRCRTAACRWTAWRRPSTTEHWDEIAREHLLS